MSDATMIAVNDEVEMSLDNIIDVLRAKSIDQPDGCWEWTGSKTGNGYPQYYVGGRYIHARRLTVAAALGRQTHDGMDGFMTCLHRWCVNPAHVEEKSRAEIRSLVRSSRPASAIPLEERVALQWQLFLELINWLEDDANSFDDLEVIRQKAQAL